ncbi:MAG TPA: hypothetical protein VK213_11620 [Bacteroidales bacterium]|nr:hypothetical protein [Bacteroidales bacterium]
MKSRPIILIIITLLIGFILGMLTSAQIRYHKLKPMRIVFSEERFREGFYNIIQPDETQKENIEKVLNKYAAVNRDLQDSFRKDMETNMKSFRKELDSQLTKEQLNRLKEWDEKFQDMQSQMRMNRPRRDTTGGNYDRRFDREHFRQQRDFHRDSLGRDSISHDSLR